MGESNKCIVCGSGMKKLFKYRGYDYYRCGSCRHVTTWPLPSKDALREHYKEGFEKGNYCVARRHAAVYKDAMKKMVRMIASNLSAHGKSLSGSKILDVGCFTGDLMCTLRDEGADVYGVELQKEAADIAEERLPGRIYNEDILDQGGSLPREAFDVVTLLGVVEHVTDPALLISRARMFLKEGGVLVIQTPHASSALARTMGRYWPPFVPVEHIHLFSRKSLTDLLKKSGFGEVRHVRHWKTLSVSYTYGMLDTFCPELHRVVTPLYKVMPWSLKNARIPLYIGESMTFAVSHSVGMGL